jgi:alpha-1,2-mannosyltransferase
VGLSASAIRNFLTRDRAIGYLTIFAITEMALFAFSVACEHGLVVRLDQDSSTDFLSFYAAGALANAGTPWLAYDHAAHQAAEQAAIGVATIYNYFYYPPVFLLICAPLALLPYLPAFIVFQALSAAAFFVAARAIRRDLPPVVFLAFPGLWWTMGTGQNALLTAALFAAGTALVDRRPWLAGLCFGALCYKPHLALLIPVALVASGNWRAFWGAAGSASLIVAASFALLGASTWGAFLTQAATSGDVYAAHAIFMAGLTSPFGVLMTAGSGREAALAVQAIVTVLAAGIVAQVWRSSARLPVRAAILLTATPVAVPVLMFYDLMLVFVALVWLSLVQPMRDASPWRTLAMATVFLGPLLSGNLATGAPLMAASMTAAMAFGLALAIAWPALKLPRFAPAAGVIGGA